MNACDSHTLAHTIEAFATFEAIRSLEQYVNGARPVKRVFRCNSDSWRIMYGLLTAYVVSRLYV